MSGPLTVYVVDRELRAAGLAPWSPDNTRGWTTFMRGQFIYVTGDVGDALASYRPEPCAEGIRLRAQPARTVHNGAVRAVQTRRGRGQCEEPSHRFRGRYEHRNEAIADAHAAGLTLAEIAEGFSISRERVRQVIEAMGLQPRPVGRPRR